MNKELSKQLCELCGVEAKYKNTGRWLHETDDSYNTRIKNSVIYPDFGQPENFVKLIELYFTKDLTVGGYLRKENNGWHNRTTFLISLKDALYYTELRRVVLLTKAIREETWKYE